MTYEQFRAILNGRIFNEGRLRLLRTIADNPERFIGLFRPTRLRAKLLQHLLQAHEIQMGVALEEVTSALLESLGFEQLPRTVQTEDGRELDIDQHFTDGQTRFFVEQKMRDDHDSTKKRGQIQNFEMKLTALLRQAPGGYVGVVHFIDPVLTKNRAYYQKQIQELASVHDCELRLLYGAELFAYLGAPQIWEELVAWLALWRDAMPELPEIDLDVSPDASFREVRTLDLRVWRRLLVNDALWEDGVMRAVFSDGRTLALMRDHLRRQRSGSHTRVANMLAERLSRHYAQDDPDGRPVDVSLPLWPPIGRGR